MANILIVDDQAYVRKLFSEELASEGYDTLGAGDAETMRNCLNQSQPDLVLLDLYLRGSKGWEILDEIKQCDSNLPVLIVTAYDTYVDDPRLSMADGYVVKSFGCFDELKQKIGDLLPPNGNGRKHLSSPSRSSTADKVRPLFSENKTNFNVIRKMAHGMGINTYRMKKMDIIRAIQRTEGNIDCFGTDRVDNCNEDACLWRDDCQSLKQ